MRYVIDFQAN